MDKTYVAFVWHYHQPFYRSPETGLYVMPWVRLHGVKDYIGMALLLRRFPDFKATFNVVPSLVVQVQEYAEGIAKDRILEVCAKESTELTPAEQLFLLDEAFLANEEHMIRPEQRFRELFIMRDRPNRKAQEVLRRFAASDMLDLQVWANLAWFHPLVIEADNELNALVKRGRAYTEDEKRGILRKQRDVLASILPVYREMEARGQIETTTSPFYHPILPLLFDLRVARASRPGATLPTSRTGWEGDARQHVERAVTFHERIFGQKPKGMWPAEGGVSDETLDMFRQHGIQWTATDEEILYQSSGPDRPIPGASQQPPRGILYQPFRLSTKHGAIAVVFRDHLLSDLIGFEYRRWEAKRAAQDLVGRIRNAGKSSTRRPPLVTIILDGENAWEYYPHSGVEFLSSLYAEIMAAPDLETTTVSGFLKEHAPEAELRRIFPGSWIRHSFDVWIGSEEDNRAWGLLGAARSFVKSKQSEAAAGERKDAVQAAWEQVLIAEGSDWFWWYGDEHVSLQNEEFDALFRKHLESVYRHLGQEPPGDLQRPIARAPLEPREIRPCSLLNVAVDGKRTDYFEWSAAGRCRAQSSALAMDSGAPDHVTDVYYGSNKDFFFLRIDFKADPLRLIGAGSAIELNFISPRTLRVTFRDLRSGAPRAKSSEDITGWAASLVTIFEARLPLPALRAKQGDLIEFFVQYEDEGKTERLPASGTLRFLTPSNESDHPMWIA